MVPMCACAPCPSDTGCLLPWPANTSWMEPATNLLTWTNYTGLDPEIARDFESPTDRNMSGSITYLTAPQEKSYSISLSVNF
jgi:hypothetical protein